MELKYLLFSENGYREVTPEEMALPYRISPKEISPQILLGDLLRALGQTKGLSNVSPGFLDPSRPLVIRSEKHGPYYHVLSLGDEDRAYLCLLVAITERAKALLASDLKYLTLLKERFAPYFPEVYGLREIEIKGVHISVGILEWLYSYHEIHAVMTPSGIFFELWDPVSIRLLDQREIYQFFSHSAEILFLCYDPIQNRRITGWSHITGDFVYNPTIEAPNPVFLTTIRGYNSYKTLPRDHELKDLYSKLCLVLEVLLLNRIDKEKGVGEILLLPEITLKASISGLIKNISRLCHGFIQVLDLLREMSQGELKLLYEALLPEMEITNEVSESLLGFLDRHVEELSMCIRGVDLP